MSFEHLDQDVLFEISIYLTERSLRRFLQLNKKTFMISKKRYIFQNHIRVFADRSAATIAEIVQTRTKKEKVEKALVYFDFMWKCIDLKNVFKYDSEFKQVVKNKLIEFEKADARFSIYYEKFFI